MEKIINIPVDSIRIVNNTRRVENENSIKELADSIRENGLLQPITVMKQEDGYRLIFGHRRFSAIQTLEWKKVPCITTVLTEEGIISAQLVENIQRQDISPIDEQYSFQELINAKWSVKQISDSIGKSETYVRGRLNLSLLIPEIQLLVNDGICSLSHAFEFVKLTSVDQGRLLSVVAIKNNQKEIIGLEPVKELRHKIDNTIRVQLANAPFPMDDSKSFPGPGSCVVCPKRSGANRSLFPDVDQEDLCFDPTCYREKLNTFIQNQKKEWESKGVEVVLITDKWTDEKTLNDNGISLSFRQNFMPEDIDTETLFPVKKVAIAIDSYDNSKIGKARPVFTDKQYLEYQKFTNDISDLGSEEQAAEIEKQVATKNAINTFNRDIINKIALNISQQENPVMPDGILRFYVEKVYSNLDDNQLRLFVKHYEWAVDVEVDIPDSEEKNIITIDHSNMGWQHKENMFIKNIYRYSGRDLLEMSIYACLLLMQGDRMDMSSFSFSCLIGTAKQLNINPEKIRDNAGKQFGVDLSGEVNFITE